MTTYLRPQAAAAAYGVSLRTLARWAAADLIGRTRVDGCSWYLSSDIEDLLSHNTEHRADWIERLMEADRRAESNVTDISSALAYFASPSATDSRQTKKTRRRR